MKLGFVGAGVVGTALSVSLAAKGYSVVAVGSRTRASAERLAERLPGCRALSLQEVADEADLVFVTTPDDAIAGVVADLRWHAGQAVVHCSGAASTDVLAPARSAGAIVGGFHPLQTFASPEQAIQNLPGTTFALEAEPPLLDHLATLATALGGTWVRLRPEDKVLYHAAAVFASNYLVTLVKLATDLWREFGVETPEATRALLPLLQGTLNNLGRVGLPRCLTGPIARGDVGTVRRHLAALEKSVPGMLETYRRLGCETIQIGVAKGTLDPARAEELGRLLGERTSPGYETPSGGRRCESPSARSGR